MIHLTSNRIAIILTILTWIGYWGICKTGRQKLSFMIFSSVSIMGVLSFKYFSLKFILLSFAILLVGNTFIYYGGKFLQKQPRLIYLILAILFPLGALFFIKLLQPMLVDLPWFPQIAVPLGISYYTFKHVHFLIDSSRDQFKQNDLLTFTSYVFFFPMFLSGPIERYQNFYPQAQKINFCREDMSVGFERVLIGLSQKLIVSDMLLSAFLPPDALIAKGANDFFWYQLLFAGFIKFLTIYFDFAGYTSIAIGLGRLFGFKLMENFNFPLLRPTLAEFWRHWHISLSSWARDYVYFPMLMKYRTSSVALICTMLTIGMWHSILPGWLLWGLHHGFGLLVLNYYQRVVSQFRLLNRVRSTKLWWCLSVVTVWWYVSLGHSLTFRPDSIETALSFYLKLISFGWLK